MRKKSCIDFEVLESRKLYSASVGETGVVASCEIGTKAAADVVEMTDKDSASVTVTPKALPDSAEDKAYGNELLWASEWSEPLDDPIILTDALSEEAEPKVSTDPTDNGGTEGLSIPVETDGSIFEATVLSDPSDGAIDDKAATDGSTDDSVTITTKNRDDKLPEVVYFDEIDSSETCVPAIAESKTIEVNNPEVSLYVNDAPTVRMVFLNDDPKVALVESKATSEPSDIVLTSTAALGVASNALRPRVGDLLITSTSLNDSGESDGWEFVA
jgi:hypothetical protein